MSNNRLHHIQIRHDASQRALQISIHHLTPLWHYHPYQRDTQDKEDNYLSGNLLFMRYIGFFSNNKAIIANHCFILNWASVRDWEENL